MPSVANVFQKTRLLVGLLAALTSTSLAAGISASATLSDTQPTPGVWNYSITLNNTGTTTIGTFWFAWIPGAGFLTTAPSSISSPAGWNAVSTNAGDAIQWTSASSLLTPGQSLTGFNFISTETPMQLLGTFAGSPTGVGAGVPDLTSVAYAGAPLVGTASQFVVSTAAVTPEAGSLLLTLTGFGMAAATLRSRLARRA